MGQKKDKKQNENSGLGLRGLMYHNGFILVCCFLVSVVVWFVMAAGSDMNRTTVIKDVPVSVSLSSQAEAEGLRRGVGPAGSPGDPEPGLHQADRQHHPEIQRPGALCQAQRPDRLSGGLRHPGGDYFGIRPL